MLSRVLIFSLLFTGTTHVIGAEQNEDAKAMALVRFILDVTTYEGMFYSVHDFCAPKTDSSVALLSKRQWHEKNKELLAARDSMERQYFQIIRGRGVEAEAIDKLDEVKRTTFARAHDHNRLYKDILPLQDKFFACSKRLGEMSSDSMSFQAVAADSYKFWRATNP